MLPESFGPYQLIARLGIGGMAEVFLARVGEGAGAKHLAIKRLLPRYCHSPRLVQRLADEARVCVWLRHPNIVQVFDFGRIGDAYFMAMEYVDGCDLHALLSPAGKLAQPLPIDLSLELGVQIVDALRCAHTCTDREGKPLQIVHRDVSPHNVLISRDGHPKLADFGVARAALELRDKTLPGEVLGKASYMAPEQAAGRPCDLRVDLYATGATLYQMLTGAKPFPNRSNDPASWERLPPPPSSLRPGLPPLVDELVLRALAPRREDRYASADEMGLAIMKALAASGGQPRPDRLATLVAEALRGGPPAREVVAVRAAPPDIPIEEVSLIPGEVTLLRTAQDLPITAPPIPEPDRRPPSTGDDTTVTAPRASSVSAPGAVSAPRALSAPRGDAEPSLSTARWRPPQEHEGRPPSLLERLLRGQLDRASWLLLVLIGLAMLLLGVCVGRVL